MNSNAKKNSGAALISALLIMALTASVATVMAVSLRVDIRRTTLITNADQSYLAAQLVENWSLAILVRANKLKTTSDRPQIPYYVFPATTINGIRVSGYLQDQQGLFNINSLINANNQIYFIRLLKAVDPKVSDVAAGQIALAITNWISPADPNKPDVYLEFKPAYRAAHRLMTSASELRLVAGIDARRYELLRPYLTALPITDQAKSYQININSAPAPVLMTLAKTINYDVAQTIISHRKEIGLFKTTGAFSEYLTQLNITPDEGTQLNNLTTTTSSYFLATAYAQMGDQQLTLYSLLQTATGSTSNNQGQDQAQGQQQASGQTNVGVVRQIRGIP